LPLIWAALEPLHPSLAADPVDFFSPHPTDELRGHSPGDSRGSPIATDPPASPTRIVF